MSVANQQQPLVMDCRIQKQEFQTCPSYNVDEKSLGFLTTAATLVDHRHSPSLPVLPKLPTEFRSPRSLRSLGRCLVSNIGPDFQFLYICSCTNSPKHIYSLLSFLYVSSFTGLCIKAVNEYLFLTEFLLPILIQLICAIQMISR